MIRVAAHDARESLAKPALQLSKVRGHISLAERVSKQPPVTGRWLTPGETIS